MSGSGPHIVVVGGGITGLAAAHRALRDGRVTVTVLEADSRLGGKIRTSPFAGLNTTGGSASGIDEGADAYLSRVPQAVRLAREVGLGDVLTRPEPVHAAVWHRGLHPIPDGLLLGVPTGAMALARSPLISRRGRLRAALEPVLPSGGDHHDSIGRFVRSRFGREVHQLLVDPLVGGIYASDTENFSLEMVPQLHDLSHGRSVLLAARKRASAATGTPDGRPAPVFETPTAGMGALVEATAAAVGSRGGSIRVSTRVTTVHRTGHQYVVEVESPEGRSELRADAVIITTPGGSSGNLLRNLDTDVADAFGATEHASVVMVTLKTHESTPASLRGLSGYLVPKPDQDRVTAVSFGSNKWAHWAPADGSMVLRVSLGRDGVPTHDLVHEWTDERLVTRVVDEVSHHTGFTITPEVSRVSRWPDAFPQYRPGHGARIADIERRLAAAAPRVRLAGASVRGIGIPACVGQGETVAEAILAELGDLRN